MGSKAASDAGLLAYRELNERLGLTATAVKRLEDSRTGRNTRHALLPLIRQSIYSRLAGYEDVNDAERLCVDQAYGTSRVAAPANRRRLGKVAWSPRSSGTPTSRPVRGLHRHESCVASKESGQVLQRSWNGGAMDQGGQECRQVDSALLPDLPGKPRSSATLRLGVQPQELPPPAGTSKVCPVWSLTTLKEKLVKIGAKVTRHAKYVTFQLAEVAVPRQLFASILERIGRLKNSPALCPSG